MKITLLFCWLLLAITDANSVHLSKCVQINDETYERNVLKNNIFVPYHLIVDYSTNEVYFSDLDVTRILNINDKTYVDIKEKDMAFIPTIDQKTHTVYFGSKNGIYKYNRDTGETEQFGSNNDYIVNIYYNDVLYYTKFPSLTLFTYINGEETIFKDLEYTEVDLFIIDSENTMFFTNASGLYTQEKGTKNPTFYPHKGNRRALATDINGKAYVGLEDGIYTVNQLTKSLNKVVDVNNLYGLTFDKDNNIVYSDKNNLVLLKPNKWCME